LFDRLDFFFGEVRVGHAQKLRNGTDYTTHFFKNLHFPRNALFYMGLSGHLKVKFGQ
jgi:hypothetical protein